MVKSSEKKSNIFSHMTGWGIGAGVSLLITVGILVYWGYMTLEVKKQQEIFEQREAMVKEKEMMLEEENNNLGIRKFNAARYIAANGGVDSRKGRTEYLIELYDMLIALDASDRNISLEEYTIQDDRVSIRGKVPSLQTLYREGGLLESLEALPFMKSINIPSYARPEDDIGFVFSLTAEIFEYEG